MNNYRIFRNLTGMLLAMTLLAGCAATGKPPEEAVLERAQERLDLVVAEDYAAAYEYLSPGYRSSVTLAAYQRNMALRQVRWTSAEAVGSECSQDVCKVRISIGFSVYGALPGVTSFDSRGGGDENWVRIDGTWYHLPKD